MSSLKRVEVFREGHPGTETSVDPFRPREKLTAPSILKVSQEGAHGKRSDLCKDLWFLLVLQFGKC